MTKNCNLLKLYVCSVEKLGFDDMKGEDMQKIKWIIYSILFLGAGSLYANADNTSLQLTEKEVLKEYESILGDEDLMEDFDNDYIDFIWDINGNPKAKKLIISIYNENKASFEQLADEIKANAYNSIFYAAASISKPNIYGWTEAKDRLNQTFSGEIAIVSGGKLSELIKFFDEESDNYDKLAKEYSEELKKQMAVIKQKEKNVEQKEKNVEQTNRDIEAMDGIIKNLDKLLGV